MNILFISNDQQTFIKANTFFSKLGYQCVLVAGDDILLSLSKQSFDIIVIDLVLKKSTGILVCKEIRTSHLFQDIPIILMSQDMSEKNILVGLTSGANDFIAKPVSFVILKLRLENLNTLHKSRLLQKEELKKSQYSEEEKKKVIKVLAHDLRSPLTGIKGLVALIQETDIPLEEIRKLLKVVGQSIDDVLLMITEILESTSLTQNPTFLAVDLIALLNRIIGVIKLDAISKNIKLTFIANEKELFVNCIEVQIMRVLQNLLNNAIKYTNNGGEIKVRLEVKSVQVNIVIEDNGLGIDPETLNIIKKRKQTARSPGTNNEKSFGIGLQIVQSILEGHGGTLKLESSINKGTKAVVSLPIG